MPPLMNKYKDGFP